MEVLKKSDLMRIIRIERKSDEGRRDEVTMTKYRRADVKASGGQFVVHSSQIGEPAET
jgi:hypothetical protein